MGGHGTPGGEGGRGGAARCERAAALDVALSAAYEASAVLREPMRGRLRHAGRAELRKARNRERRALLALLHAALPLDGGPGGRRLLQPRVLHRVGGREALARLDGEQLLEQVLRAGDRGELEASSRRDGAGGEWEGGRGGRTCASADAPAGIFAGPCLLMCLSCEE